MAATARQFLIEFTLRVLRYESVCAYCSECVWVHKEKKLWSDAFDIILFIKL